MLVTFLQHILWISHSCKVPLWNSQMEKTIYGKFIQKENSVSLGHVALRPSVKTNSVLDWIFLKNINFYQQCCTKALSTGEIFEPLDPFWKQKLLMAHYACDILTTHFMDITFM